MPTCLLNVVKILAMRAPVAVSSTALICIKWESFNWVSCDSCQVFLSVCYKMGKSRATDPPSLAHSLFNTIQSLSLSFTSFPRQTCLDFIYSLTHSSLSLSPFYETYSDLATPHPWIALSSALSAVPFALLLMLGGLLVVGFLSAAMCCNRPLTAVSPFLAPVNHHGSRRALHSTQSPFSHQPVIPSAPPHWGSFRQPRGLEPPAPFTSPP